jgi:ParB family chromosome partitioning protein
MQRHGYTQEAVGRVIGKPRTTVGEIIVLNTLPSWLVEEARSRPVARHLLVQLARIEEAEDQRAAWEAVKKGASVRAIKATRVQKGAAPEDADPGRAKQIVSATRQSLIDIGRLPIADLRKAGNRAMLLKLRRMLDEILARIDDERAGA